MRRPERARPVILAGLLLAALAWPGAPARAQEATTATAAPVALAPAAPAKTRLETRAAVHPGFARLVFAGTGGGPSVPFKATVTDDGLTIHFDRPVEAPLDPVRRALGPYLDQLAASPDGLTVTAHLKRPVALQQATYDASTLVVDLVDKPKPAAEAKAPAPQPAAAPEQKPAAAPEQKPAQAAPTLPAKAEAKPTPVRVRIGDHGKDARLVFEWPKPVDYKLVQNDGKAQLTFDQPAKIDMVRFGRNLPTRLRPATLSADGTQLEFALPPGLRVNDSRQANLIVLDVVPGTPPAAAPVVAEPPPAAPPAPAPAAPTVAEAPVPAVHAPTPPAEADQDAPVATGQVSGTLGSAAENGLQIRYTLIDDGVSLRFEWRQPAAAAIFRRGNAVWMVFDRAQKMDFGDFRAANWPVITSIAQVPSRSGTVLRLSVWAGFNPSVRRAGTAWIVELRNQPQRSDAPVQGQVRSDGPNASMIFPASDPSGPISVIDPDAGDVLVTVPLPQLGQGSDLGAEFPDFRVLPSAQGLVFRPASDQLAIRAQPSQVELSAPGGLTLSSDADRHAERASRPDQKRVFNPVDWLGHGEDFTPRRQALMQAITTASPDDKNGARIDLARFFFANSMGTEALSVLRVIEHDAPGMFDDPNLRALRGASEELANQLDTASSDLGDPSLDDRADGQLWRAVLAADRGQWTDALNAYAKANNVLRNYPDGLRNRLSIKLAEALLNAGDRDKAAALAADVLAHNPPAGEADRAKVLQGRVLAIQGDAKQAIELWSQVSKSPDSSLARAQATYAMTLSKLEAKEIDRADAIAALDRLRFVWRGDDFEVRVLRKLAELQIADGDYRSGFRSLRQVLASYGDSPVAHGVADEMQRYFVDLFLGKAADNVPPLKQLGLYDEFKELTPPGAVGDEIIRKLADQLVKVDLLDRAAELLENQVKTRLTGVDQARVAAQLALVRLLDRRPDDALAALDIPVPPDLPPELVNQRLELRARALAEQNKNDDALKLLAADASPDADRLRVDIYWKTQNWAAVVPVLKRGLKSPEAGKVDEDTARAVLKIATAMVLGKDRTGLAALQKQYGAAMDQSVLKDDFRVVAGNSSATSGDFKSLADRVAQISDLQGFMTTYRQRLAKDRLSQIN
ncbi:MAG TPA: tetratricopeptide repeat protein [Aliidongia sp.]|nr:tetratricopeptide repeat protein [Aliidongia sp.]